MGDRGRARVSVLFGKIELLVPPSSRTRRENAVVVEGWQVEATTAKEGANGRHRAPEAPADGHGRARRDSANGWDCLAGRRRSGGLPLLRVAAENSLTPFRNQNFVKVAKFTLNHLERKPIQGLMFSASAVRRNFWAARLKVYPTKERETFNFLAISLKLLP